MKHRNSPTTAPLAVPLKLAPGVLTLIEGQRVPCTVEVVWNPGMEVFEMRRLIRQGWSSAF